MNNILDSNIQELINYAHLFPDGNIPVITRDPWEFARGNNWAEKLINIVSDEVYIGLGVKLFLGIDLFPFQITILRTLWTKKLPIFIATRGGGKSFLLAVYAVLRSILDQGTKVVIVAASFRQSKIVFNYIQEIWNKSPVLQSMTGTGKTNGPKTDVDMCRLRIGDSLICSVPLGDGCLVGDTTLITSDKIIQPINKCYSNIEVWGNGKFNLSDEFYDNGVRQTKKIITKKGYNIEGTYNHKIKIVRNKKIIWCRFDEVKINDRVLIDQSERWHDEQTKTTEDQAYAIGLLTGDGCFTQKYQISYRTIDLELIQSLSSIWDFKQLPSDKSKYVFYGKNYRKNILNKFGISEDHIYTKDKEFPTEILKSNKEIVTAFIQGLFDTDGTLEASTAKGGTAICVSFCNTSEILIRQLHYILLHYGIISTIVSRKRNDNWERSYDILITGTDVLKFYKQIGFRLKRKQNMLKFAIENKKRWVDLHDSIPDIKQDMMDICKQYRYKSKKNYGAKLCPCILTENRNCVKLFLDKYGHIDDERIAQIRQLCDENIFYDEVTSITNSENHTYDIHIPDGHEYCANGFFSHNTKIRGLRANIVLVDEYASVPEEILNVVVKGFGVVARDPVEEVKQKSLIRRLKDQGQWDQETQDSISAHESMNQIIYSGTANYQFNHFYRDFMIWRSIIESKGDTRKLARKMTYLREQYGYEYDLPEELSWKDYAIIRLPHHMLPEGFLKEDYIAGIRASMHIALYHMEYGCIFKKDSMGFYRRSLIENATTNKPLMLPGGEEVEFTPLLRGTSGHDYIMGIDPAAEHDNFAIVILEVHPTHRRIVYCWATNKKDFNKRRKAGEVKENEYYSFCGRKIKQLVRDFRIVRIEIDAGGGGTAVGGCLMNQDLLEEHDTPIYEIKNVITPNITDTEPGLHILHYVKATTEWNSQANHQMKSDLENKRLLFPKFDVMSVDIAQATDKIAGLNFDNMEDNTINIEDLKNELTSIIISETVTGKERFDVPKKKESAPESGRKKITSLRKDRFSALLMVNLYANEMDMERFTSMKDYEPAGGIIIDPTNTDMELYTGMSRFINAEDWM